LLIEIIHLGKVEAWQTMSNDGYCVPLKGFLKIIFKEVFI